MEEEIREKMKIISARWVGKPEPDRESQEYWQRGFDRLIYKQLLKKLNHFKNGETNIPIKSDPVPLVEAELLTPIPPEQLHLHNSVPDNVNVYSINGDTVTIRS